jgi:pimeloyl-ACP methyl ester carboxylesterase
MKAAGGDDALSDLWPLYDGLRDLPVMLIRGGASDLLDEACAAQMRARHPGLVYLEVPGIGHAPMLNEPGVAEAVGEFINS